MATTTGKVFRSQMAERFGVIMKRQYHLQVMEDKVAKEWIIELQAEVARLQDEKSRILRAKGNSAFNSVHY